MLKSNKRFALLIACLFAMGQVYTYAQPVQNTIKVGILYYQYKDSSLHVHNGLGGWGYIDTDDDHIPDQGIKAKYRFRDYYDMWFSESLPLWDNINNFHPDFESHSALDWQMVGNVLTHPFPNMRNLDV